MFSGVSESSAGKHGRTYDMGEDDEQYERLQDCIELFVASGYFRARVKGLPPFDKVISIEFFLSYF